MANNRSPVLPLDVRPTLITDGRQSPTALRIARGTQRMLANLGFASMPEVTLADARRADILALGEDGSFWIIEIKSSVADFRADKKWLDYHAFCDQFFFAVAQDMPPHVLPEETGLIIADAYGAEILRPACEHKLSAARRRALLLRFARQGAQRLHRLMDPQI